MPALEPIVVYGSAAAALVGAAWLLTRVLIRPAGDREDL